MGLRQASSIPPTTPTINLAAFGHLRLRLRLRLRTSPATAPTAILHSHRPPLPNHPADLVVSSRQSHFTASPPRYRWTTSELIIYSLLHTFRIPTPPSLSPFISFQPQCLTFAVAVDENTFTTLSVFCLSPKQNKPTSNHLLWHHSSKWKF